MIYIQALLILFRLIPMFEPFTAANYRSKNECGVKYYQLYVEKFLLPRVGEGLGLQNIFMLMLWQIFGKKL